MHFVISKERQNLEPPFRTGDATVSDSTGITHQPSGPVSGFTTMSPLRVTRRSLVARRPQCPSEPAKNLQPSVVAAGGSGAAPEHLPGGEVDKYSEAAAVWMGLVLRERFLTFHSEESPLPMAWRTLRV